MKQTFYQILIILCAAAVISLVFNQVRSGGVPLILNNNPPQDDDGPVREVSLDKAYKVFRGGGNSLFIDARPDVDFEQGHIKGSVNLYEKDFDEWIDDFLSRTDPETTIITYCDGSDCLLGKNLAEKLFSVGYNNVYYLTNGWTSWKDKFKSEILEN